MMVYIPKYTFRMTKTKAGWYILILSTRPY